MRRSPATVPVLAAWLALAVPGQEVAAFDAARAAWLAARDAESAPRLAQQASDLFLALPEGSDRASRLAVGALATLMAGRAAMALELAAAGRRAGDGSPMLATTHLRALVQLGHLPEFVAQAQADRARSQQAVDDAMRAEEGRLLPLADTALRTGDTVTGRFVFEQLAALEPVDAVRLANLALTQRHLGALEAARATYERARSLAPHDADIENDWGLFLRATDRPATAAVAFWRSLEIDLAGPPDQAGKGPAVTNLMHLEALRPGAPGMDPLPAAVHALALRPDAAMLKRLVLDVTLDRLQQEQRR